jgi:hypothetical protein
MFPDSKDAPPEQPQFSRTTPIPAAISHEFLFPVGPVVLGQTIASRTTMPKAAVKKDGYSPRSKNKIGLPWQVEVPSPARDSSSSEDGNENALCGGVILRSNTRHIARALFPSQPVRHGSLYFFSGLIFSNFVSSQRRRCN